MSERESELPQKPKTPIPLEANCPASESKRETKPIRFDALADEEPQICRSID
jgi:hypothetical protein